MHVSGENRGYRTAHGQADDRHTFVPSSKRRELFASEVDPLIGATGSEFVERSPVTRQQWCAHPPSLCVHVVRQVPQRLWSIAEAVEEQEAEPPICREIDRGRTGHDAVGPWR
jgi:hypothetical protein